MIGRRGTANVARSGLRAWRAGSKTTRPPLHGLGTLQKGTGGGSKLPQSEGVAVARLLPRFDEVGVEWVGRDCGLGTTNVEGSQGEFWVKRGGLGGGGG